MLHFLGRNIHISFIPVVFAIGVITSIVLIALTNTNLPIRSIWLLFAATLLIINFIRPNFFVFICALLAGLIVGTFRVQLEISDQNYLQYLFGQTVIITGQVYEDPDIDASTQTIYLNSLKLENGQKLRGSLYINLSSSTPTHRYQELTLQGKLSSSFGFFVASMHRPKILKIQEPTHSDFALILRDFFATKIKQNITSPQSDLALGYLVGQKKSLPSDLDEALRVVGLTHIVVASGYNLFILVSAMRKIFSKISRFAALLFSTILILLFMAIVGFSPSMMRAGAVSLLGLFTWFFGRKFHPVKLILLVASFTLLLNPSYILNLGWLLSFGSFIGVMLVAPLLARFFYGDKKPNFLSTTIIETLSAQLCCLPLILYFFGSLSVISLFANIIVLPTISFVMLLTFLTGVTFFLPVMPTLFGFISEQILSFHIFVTKYLANVPWALVEIENNNTIVLLIYPCIFLLLLYFYKSTKYRFMQANMIQ